MPYRNHEVHLQALLVTEVIEFSPPAGVDLRFDNLGGKEALEEDTEPQDIRSQVLPARRGPVSTMAGNAFAAAMSCDSSARLM